MILKITSKGHKYFAIYDDEHTEMVNSKKWYLARGYARTKITEDGIRYSISMHRLLFGYKKAHMHHINGNKLDNRQENLLELSVSEHHKKHSDIYRKNGAKSSTCFKDGQNNPCAKLTGKEVLEIRNLHSQGMSGRKIAEMYNMGSTTINYLLQGKTWKNIK